MFKLYRLKQKKNQLEKELFELINTSGNAVLKEIKKDELYLEIFQCENAIEQIQKMYEVGLTIIVVIIMLFVIFY